MSKFIIVLLFFLLSFLNSNSQTKLVLKSKTHYHSNDQKNWNVRGREDFDYDDKGKLINITGSGSIFLITECFWDGTHIKEKSIDTFNLFEYYNDGKLKTHHNRTGYYQYYSGTNHYYWEDTIKTFYYNNNKLTEINILVNKSQKYDSSSIMFKYLYKPVNPNKIEIYRQDFSYYSNSWLEPKKYKVEYYNNKDEIIKDSLIELYEINEYEYDNNNDLKVRKFTKSVNEFHYQCTTYYSINKIDSIIYKDEAYTEVSYKYWVFCRNEWKETYFYDKDMNLLNTKKVYFGSMESSGLAGYEKADYSYGQINVDVKNSEINQIGKVSISPNPVTDFLQIYSEKIDKIEIFTALGIKCREQACLFPTEWREKIDVSCLPSGVYFVRVGDKVEKFVKI